MKLCQLKQQEIGVLKSKVGSLYEKTRSPTEVLGESLKPRKEQAKSTLENQKSKVGSLDEKTKSSMGVMGRSLETRKEQAKSTLENQNQNQNQKSKAESLYEKTRSPTEVLGESLKPRKEQAKSTLENQKSKVDAVEAEAKKNKKNFIIKEVSKSEAAKLLNKFHYLSKLSKGFKSGINFGCFLEGDLVGIAIFTGFPVPELTKGMFGLERNCQEGFFELSRLCLVPEIQKSEHNLASWFLARCIKLLRKKEKVRAILSYADSKYHKGTIYAACNFKYFGLTASKKDFYKTVNGELIKQSRGKVKGVEGKWMPRTRKHRFVMIFDKTLKMKWKEEKWRA